MGILIPIWGWPIFLYVCLLFWNLSRGDYYKSNDIFDHVMWKMDIEQAKEAGSTIRTLAKYIHDCNVAKFRKAIPRH